MPASWKYAARVSWRRALSVGVGPRRLRNEGWYIRKGRGNGAFGEGISSLAYG